MNKYLYILLLAIALAGCKKDSTSSGSVTYDPYGEVEYSVDTGDMTKAYVIENSSSLTDMGIIATATGSDYWNPYTDKFNLILNQRLTLQGERWEYEDGEEVSWNNPASTDYFTFFGYAPYQYIIDGEDEYTLLPIYNNDENESYYPELSYVVPTDLNFQSDVMIAEPVIDIHRPTNNSVYMLYHHALTCVGFQIRELLPHEDSVYTRQVTKIGISGVKSSGATMMNGYDIDWATTSDTETYYAGIQYDDNADYYTLRDIDEYLATTYIDPQTAYSTNLMRADGYMMLLPQDVSNAEIMVEFTNGDVYTYNLSGTWSPNQRIVYNITVGSRELESVTVDAYNWEETLIILTEGAFYVSGDSEVLVWEGAIVNPSGDISSGSSEDGNSAAHTESVNWTGYISPGLDYNLGGTSSGDPSSGAGTSPLTWDASLVYNRDYSEAGSSSGTSGGGTTGEWAEDWDSSFVFDESSSGDTSTDVDTGGTTGEWATEWNSTLVYNTDTSQGTSNDVDTGGTTGEWATDWNSTLVYNTDMSEGTSNDVDTDGGSGESAEGWTGTVETNENITLETTTTDSYNNSSESSDSWENTVVNLGGVKTGNEPTEDQKATADEETYGTME